MAADDDSPRPPAAPGDDAHLIERCIETERVFTGLLLDVRRDRVRLPDGDEATREYIVHPGAVLIVPVLDDGRLVVERQFRYPNQQVFIEFPAGKRDAGESPLQTAQRELEEEAGYAASRWTHLGRIHSIVSYSTEAIEIYLAQRLVHVGAALDRGEFLDIVPMTYDALLAAADAGDITDAKTIAALFHLSRRNLLHAATRLRIAGRVQGVGFRDAMLRVATTAGVTGWVRNRRDGSVEALVQGDSAGIDKVIAWARRGPPGARVEAFDVDTRSVDVALAGFVIKPTE